MPEAQVIPALEEKKVFQLKLHAASCFCRRRI